MGFLDRDRYDDLAKQLGATVVRERKRPALLRNGVLVDFVEHFGGMTSESAWSRVRYHAELPSPGLPKFRIYPEGFKSFMSKLVGGEDLALGHRAVDLKFMVKAHTPAVVKELWTPALCDRLDGLYNVWIEADDRVIELERRFYGDLNMDPVPAVELLFALGDVDLYGRDVLRALPEAQFRPELGEVWLPGPNPVRMGFIRTDESVCIKARMLVEQDVALTDELERMFAQTGAHVARADEDVVLVWDDFERDPARLLRGVELLRQLVGAVPGDGVFR